MEEALYEREETDHLLEADTVDDLPDTKRARVDGEAGTDGPAETTVVGKKRFQLKISGLDKNLVQRDIKKAIDAAGIEGVVKLKKVHGLQVGAIFFESDAARAKAVPLVQAFSLKKTSRIAVECIDQDENGDGAHTNGERSVREDKRDDRGKRKREEEEAEDTRTPQERINDQVTPLWRKPYEEQLQVKSMRFKNGLGTLKKNLLGFLNHRDVTEEKKADLAYLRDLHKGQRLCPLEDTVPSPVIDDYRTKCEFTVGFDLEGKKSVGFLLGMYKDGVTTVLAPTECKNVPAAAKDVASFFHEFINASELDVYDRVKKAGFWRLVQVRTHTTGDVMVLIQINPENIEPEVVAKELESLSTKFQATGKVTTLLVQESNGKFNGFSEAAPMRILFGDGVIFEELLGLRFRISPTAFFQVNTPATNGLYGRVRDWCANPAPYPGSAPAVTNGETSADATEPAATNSKEVKKASNVVLLDLCCGTGTIGLTMAPNVKRVVGVEMVADAVKDAEFNARMQGATNVHYICSKVEDAMREVFTKHVENGDEVVAVLDPPRVGVHSAVIQAVRGCKGIKRVVFISCDFEAAMSNFVDLCRPTSKKYQGRPFRPVRAIPFDLFPHTSHCEFVMELQRQDE
ncbi:tRNA methyltransferase 2 [Chytriomyces hyalinus]|nr:tRNA methyltransferase 2 [Chytriomyces hyalinus]